MHKLLNSSLFTFWSFCCEFRIKIKRIFRSASCRLKRGMNFSSVQFLKRKVVQSGLKSFMTPILLNQEVYYYYYYLNQILTFQSILEKNGCLLISSTPSGPAPFLKEELFFLVKRITRKLYFFLLLYIYVCIYFRNVNKKMRFC